MSGPCIGCGAPARSSPVTNENAYTALIGVLEEFVGRAIAPDPISWSEVVE
jgi:hypothetical protein